MRKTAFIIALMVSLVPFAQALGPEGGTALTSIAPFDSDPEWSDPLDDLSHVYVPPGGLAGVEVSGGDAHLKAGQDEGWIASSIISCPKGYRYDLVLIEADLPGGSHINVSILNATEDPPWSGFANGTIPGFTNMTGTEASLFRLPHARYSQVRIQVNLFANGTDRPRLLSWSLLFIPLGQWEDGFLGTAKMESQGGINVTAGQVILETGGSGGMGLYDPYPPVLFPSSRSNVAVFHPTSSHSGYQNAASIANTDYTMGLDRDDLDGDGHLDIVLARGDNANKKSAILWGSSSGKWSMSDSTTLDVSDMPGDAATGDFDGDGDVDVVLTAPGAMILGNGYIWLNQGSGQFNAKPDVTFQGVGGNAVDGGDVNNDGYDDVIFVQSILSSARCFYGGAGGPDTTSDLTFLSEITVHPAVGQVVIDDIDQDGHQDVVFATQNDDKEAPIYMGSDTGVDTTADYELLQKAPPQRVAVGDVNGDGHKDIAYAAPDNTGGNAIIDIFKGSSGGWSKDDRHTINALATALELVDVDRDGYDDILTGASQDFKVYYGGTTWPTGADLTKSGLTSPSDMTVAVPQGAGGGFYGYLVTEKIPLPSGRKWDILYLEGEELEETEVTVTVLDQKMEPILGYQDVRGFNLDLSPIVEETSIHVKVSLRTSNATRTPVLERLLVNWVDWNVWREQFYGMAKVEGMLGLAVRDLALKDGSDRAGRPDDLVFAVLKGDMGYNRPSVALLDDGGDYTGLGPLTFNTRGAHAVDALDVDGDGIDDLVFAIHGTSQWSFDAKSPLFLGSPAGWYDVPHHTFNTTGAMDVAVSDLNGDGHPDVVFAQERDHQGYGIDSALFWGSEDGWNTTPDVEFATTGASGVDVADLDGNGLPDLVFACYIGAQLATDSMVFLQESAGFCGTVPSVKLATVGARAVACGDLDGDTHVDVAFANHFDGQTYQVDSAIYWNDGSGGFDASPTELPTVGAMDVELVDVDRDSDLDMVFANNRNASSGYLSDSHVYRNGGSGDFGPSPDVRLRTDGAYAAEAIAGGGSLVFACRNNGTTHRIPSLLFSDVSAGAAQSPDLELPTVGAVDVLGLALNDPDRGGYVSKAIRPDASFDVGAYHTLSYQATMTGDDEGRLAILDALTGRKLAETKLLDGGHEWDLRDVVSYRDHPSIRVTVSMEGLEHTSGFVLDDIWLNWSRRVHLAPRIVGMGLTNDTVHRTQAVQLWVNGSDEYDLPEDLHLTVEHQLAGGAEWETYLLGAPSFSDGLWWVDVQPERTAPIGEYRFRANVTDGDGLFSGDVELDGTLQVLPNLLGPPVLLKATAEDSRVDLQWRGPMDQGDLPPEGYRVLRGPTEDDLTVIATVDAFTTRYEDGEVTNGQTYYYAVQATNGLGDSPLSQVLNATPAGLPGVPLDLTAEGDDGAVSLAWGVPASDGGRPLLGYHVYRQAGGAALELVGQTENTSFVDTEVTNGVEYRYRVGAYNALGEGLTTDPVSVTPLGLPGAPEGLTVEGGRSKVTLSWQTPSDTGGGALDGFIVYRGISPGGLEELEGLGASITQYIDEDVTVGTTYYYAVAALNAAGEGAATPVVSAVPVDLPGTPGDLEAQAGDREVVLAWSPPASDGGTGITGYLVFRGMSADALTLFANVGNVTTFTDQSVNNGRTYYYAVAAVNDLGEGEATDPVEATPRLPLTVPGRPRTLTLEAIPGQVSLIWSAPAEDGGSPVTGYVLLRGGSRDSMEVLVNLGLVTSYIDRDVDAGRTYYYSVAAVNAIGQGEGYSLQQVTVPQEEEGEGSMGLVALAIAVAVIVILLALLLARRRGAATAGDEGPPEPPAEDEVADEGDVEEERPGEERPGEERPGEERPGEGDVEEEEEGIRPEDIVVEEIEV